MAKIRTWEELCGEDGGIGQNCERIVVRDWKLFGFDKSRQDLLLAFMPNPDSSMTESTRAFVEIYLSRIEAIKLADLQYETVGDKYNAMEETETTVTPKFSFEE